MTRHRSWAVLAVWVALSAPLAAQTHDAVGLNDPAYHLLTLAQAQGWLPVLPAAKPYSRSSVLRYLRTAASHEGVSATERALIEAHLRRLDGSADPARSSRITTTGPLGLLVGGLSPVFSLRDSFEKPGNFELSSGLSSEFLGEVGDNLTFRVWGALTWDRLAPDFMTGAKVQGDSYQLGQIGAWAPYQTLKTYDGFHQGLDGSNDDGIGKYGVGYHHQSELTFQAFDDAVTARVARLPREWGQGDGSLVLSGTAPPMSGLDLQIQPAAWVNYSWLLATAGNWFNETAGNGTTEDKLFTAQRAELQPFPWLQLSVGDTVVFSKRFELDYVNPLMVGLFAQNLHGDWDNVGLTSEVTALLPVAGKLSASVSVDEVTPGDLSDVRNMVAWLGRLVTPVPLLPLTTVALQYVKIEPFAYTHYLQSNLPSLRDGVGLNLSNTTQGMNLFYSLPPNSEEWMVRLASMPYQEWSGSLTYKLIRHGTSALGEDGKPIAGRIYGDIDQPIDYLYYDSTGYPKKNFLHDGAYDSTHLIDLELRWASKDYPVILTLSYALSRTSFDANDTSVAVPAPVLQNTWGLSGTFF